MASRHGAGSLNCRFSVEEFQQALRTQGPEILKDIPNYTDIEFQMQISQSA